jgi:hypothetical protein
MKQFLTIVFTFFYTLMSVGATGFVHYCHHEQEVHFSLNHDSHLDAKIQPTTHSCCAEMAKACESNVPSSEEDCCDSAYTEIGGILAGGIELPPLFAFIAPIDRFTEHKEEQDFQLFGPNTDHGPPQSSKPSLITLLHRWVFYG